MGKWQLIKICFLFLFSFRFGLDWTNEKRGKKKKKKRRSNARNSHNLLGTYIHIYIQWLVLREFVATLTRTTERQDDGDDTHTNEKKKKTSCRYHHHMVPHTLPSQLNRALLSAASARSAASGAGWGRSVPRGDASFPRTR